MISATAHDASSQQLDREISSLKAQIAALKAQRSTQTSNIISSRASLSILNRLRAPPPKSMSTVKSLDDSLRDDTPLHTALLSNATRQEARNLECLYRACAAVTTFKGHDPDPKAVDHGNFLGIRIEVGSTGKFIRPYYIMLNKPYPSNALLRIHRHTVPPCIALDTLAHRYLPEPKVSGSTILKEKKQDLPRFVRAIRKEIVAYHNRITSIKHLRKQFKLDENVSSKGKERERVIVDISAADAEALQLRMEWVDGRIGRCLVDGRGAVKKCAIVGDDGRDRETERRVVGGDKRMETIGTRLMEGIY
ncbi:putative cenp-o kinetochore centromere component protein [Coleophoma crateriformis]|uniref:Putative cenp-o kinetochore centromere component protein n=1 Tax=Coleophoma crateriformis TaxID=565419 RepID=A0A3D8QQX9_9HELO|nr:putative cenp-o kinetochore centromere component protein [Coleophoma crateriformis]